MAGTATERNVAVVRELFVAVGDRDIGRALDVLDPEIVIHTPVPGVGNGREAFRGFISSFFNAFPEQSVELHDIITEGDKVVVRHTHRGVHGGEFLGAPPTGKAFAVEGIEIFQVCDGRIVEFWHMDDLLGLVQQLGLASGV